MEEKGKRDEGNVYLEYSQIRFERMDYPACEVPPWWTVLPSIRFKEFATKGDVPMPTPRLSLTQRAQEAAAHIGFTVRRWWRDATDSTVLCVEVERRLVGAPPAIAHLRVPLPSPPRMPRVRQETAGPPTRSRARTRPTRTPQGKRKTVRTHPR